MLVYFAILTFKQEETTMENNLKEKVLVKDKWIRALIMLLFWTIKYFTSLLINVIALFQFVYDLFAGEPNDKLLAFSQKLNLYFLQIVNFLTFNSDNMPFPFSEWPK